MTSFPRSRMHATPPRGQRGVVLIVALAILIYKLLVR